MSFEIRWSVKARQSFREVIVQIESKWTQREIVDFITKADRVFNIISTSPFIYRETQLENIRKAVITKQTSVYYRIESSYIELLFFWDNRQDPVL